MIQSFNNGRFCLWFTQWTLQPPAFLSSYFLTATIPVKVAPLIKGSTTPFLRRWLKWTKLKCNKVVILWGVRSDILGRAGRSAVFFFSFLENPELSQWKLVSALHCWNNSIIFWHESVCDSDSRSLGPHKEMECPCFATPGFTVTAIYPVELLDMQSF